MSGWRSSPAMRSSGSTVLLLALVLHSVLALVSAQNASDWLTLSGTAPVVVARGGFSGLFADSSSLAYNLALMASVPDVILWCDVQLTKDGVGICVPDVRLENSTTISSVLPKRDKTYLLDGVPTSGWFSADFTMKDLSTVSLVQGVYSRSDKFDGNYLQILTVQDVAGLKPAGQPAGLWLNIQHDMFFTQHNLSMRAFVLSVSRSVIVNYISSPEVDFMKSITARFAPSKTKLIFRFMGVGDYEPTTNQTYGSLRGNLTFIKTFASGILVPKSYIWSTDSSGYLLPATSLVTDAHKAGLEVYASGFYNDVPFSFNYSYDPVSEQLSYVDNGQFSVDGVLSDFPITPSEAINCFAHLGNNAKPQAKPLVISRYGASGDYPGCTDLAYQKAIADGVDVLDCPVQMSQDGIPFCLSSINLIDSTLIAQTSYSTLTKQIPEIMPGRGIFSFDLTWSQIKGLTPSIANPSASFTLFRNPKYKNSGTFLTLDDFLTLTKNASTLSGILISIENAAYLAENQSISVIDAVLSSLSKAGYNDIKSPKVMIQSIDSSVLLKFKGKYNYQLVYKIDEEIRDILNSTMVEIKSFADAVVVKKDSIFPEDSAFLVGVTGVVPKLQSFKLPVYVEIFTNEFVSQAWDFFSDATVEINSFVVEGNIDGVITDFPKTAARYKRNKCTSMATVPQYMTPVQVGGLLQLVTNAYLPPASAPGIVLDNTDVVESPLPSVGARAPTSFTTNQSVGTAPTSTRSGQSKAAFCVFISGLALLIAAFALF